MEIGAAISGALAAVDAMKVAIDARDQLKMQSVISEMQQRLMEAMGASISSASETIALQKALLAANHEIADLKSKAQDRDGYALSRIPGEGQYFAYASKPLEGRENPPPHYLCQGCFDKGNKMVLQASPFYGGMNYFCPGCQTTLSV